GPWRGPPRCEGRPGAVRPVTGACSRGLRRSNRDGGGFRPGAGQRPAGIGARRAGHAGGAAAAAWPRRAGTIGGMNTTVPGTSIVLTEFARKRLFRAHRRNTIQDITPEEFERHLNESAPLKVLDGYAPFCKLHVHRNWTSTRCLAVPITDDNRHLLRSDYEARTPEELP